MATPIYSVSMVDVNDWNGFNVTWSPTITPATGVIRWIGLMNLNPPFTQINPFYISSWTSIGGPGNVIWAQPDTYIPSQSVWGYNVRIVLPPNVGITIDGNLNNWNVYISGYQLSGSPA